MDGIHCSHCGGQALEPGLLADSGSGSPGYLSWTPGELETGTLGGARRYGKVRVRIDAFRCTTCSHLELFVPPPPAPEGTAPSSEPT